MHSATFLLVLLLAKINETFASCPSDIKSSDCSGSTLSLCASRTCKKYPIYIDNVDKECKNSGSYNSYKCCQKKGYYLLGSTTSFYAKSSYSTKYVVCAVSFSLLPNSFPLPPFPRPPYIPPNIFLCAFPI